jgi:ferritin-like metal-binding protein YciE
MSDLKELLIDQLQGLLDAENQLVSALPKMATAAKSPKLRESIEKHLHQTQMHVERLNQAFGLLGGKPNSSPCRAMTGLIEQGQHKITQGGKKEGLIADLMLIDAAQKVEHYEIAAYGNARTLAHELEEWEVARLLSHTLGEEESADHLLTEITKPILQQARMNDLVGAQ